MLLPELSLFIGSTHCEHPMLYDDHVNVDMYHFNMFVLDKRLVFMCDHIANYIMFGSMVWGGGGCLSRWFWGGGVSKGVLTPPPPLLEISFKLIEFK